MRRRRSRYPEGSIQNYYDDAGRFIRPRRRTNLRRWSWRFFLFRKSAPGALILFAVIAWLFLLIAGGLPR